MDNTSTAAPATAPDKADCTPGMARQAADIGLLNFKHGYDLAVSRDNQAILDNQADARAWAQLNLRKAQNAATVDHFIDMTSAAATATAEQTGQTENEQTVSPIRTATGDAIAAVPGVAAGMVSMSGGALAQLLAQTVAAVVPVVIAASGAAAKPAA